MECRGAALRPRPGAPPISPRAPCRASCRVCRLVAALVGNTLRGGPARRGVHSTWTPMAGGPATRTERRPLLGSCSRPCRARRAQPSFPAALSRDRAWQRENFAVAPGFGDWHKSPLQEKRGKKKKKIEIDAVFCRGVSNYFCLCISSASHEPVLIIGLCTRCNSTLPQMIWKTSTTLFTIEYSRRTGSENAPLAGTGRWRRLQTSRRPRANPQGRYCCSCALARGPTTCSA